MDGGTALRPAGPPRGILRAPPPDGVIEGQRVLPSPALAPFVHHFWSVRWALRAPFTADTLPHAAARIMVDEEAGRRRAVVLGVCTGRLALTRTGEGRAFGVQFRAAMFQPLLGASMTSLADRFVPLRDVLGPGGDAWARAILAKQDLAARIALTEGFLGPLLQTVPDEIARLRDLVERMAVDRALLRVEDAARAVGLDVRTLQRRFRRYVGVSPKGVIRRYRLLEAAEQLRGAHPPTLAALAASLGYADQAHFAREFKLVVGQTPRSFVEGRSPLPG